MTPYYCLQFFIFSVCVHLFTVLTYIIFYSDLLCSNNINLEIEYDYIIVGSGTAGSLIAHRLSTESNYTFIVLEAGSRSSSLFEIPVLGPLLHGSLYDWQYETVPQDNACFAMNDNKCKLPQGKIIGGSSKLNNMVHVRGNISHYYDWFHGKYTEKYINEQFLFIEKELMHLDNLQYKSELADTLLKAARELGYKELSSDFGEGFMESRLTQRNGKRWSFSNHLDISKNVMTNALVEKVLFHDKTAYGVQYMKSDRNNVIYARKGVILCSGTYNTPKILQLSGIGPSKLLKSLELPVIKNLPVGENLQDHVTTGLDLVLFNKSLKIGATDMLNPLHLFQYLFKGKGPLTTPGCEVIGFMSTTNHSTPDLQFMVLPVGISSDRGSHLRKSLGIKDFIWNNYFAKTFNTHTASILPIILHPKSEGRVFIKSKDPKIPPLINPNYLSEEDDKKILINGLKLVSKFIETESMKSIGAQMNPIKFPGCENHVLFSEIYWECYIKHFTLTSYHPIGTCSMGLPESKNSVVDTSFKVLGVNNLYVADASVLPTLPSGNINAAVAMMASVFFDTNIKANLNKTLICDKYDFLYEHIFNICIIGL